MNKKILIFGIVALLFVGLVVAKTITDTQLNKEKNSYVIKEKTGETDTEECYNVYGDSTVVVTAFKDGEWVRQEQPVNHLLGNICYDKGAKQKDKDDSLNAFKNKYTEQRKSDVAKMETGVIGR